MNEKPLVAVIILNYVTYKMTIDCIDQIRKQEYSNFFIVVVDNDSPNESSAVLAAEYSNQIVTGLDQDVPITFLKAERNGGYSYGNNIGIREAERRGAEYILILNNDASITDVSFIERSICVMASNNNIGLMGPRVTDGNSYLNPLSCERLEWRNYFIGNIRYFWKIIKNKLVPKENTIINQIKKVYTVAGCCMLLRADYFKEIGYFDENLFLYGEELIIGEKFYNKNIEVLFYPGLEVYHNDSQTISNFYSSWRVTKMMDKSILYYLKNYRKDINKFQYGLVYISFKIKDQIYEPLIRALVLLKRVLRSDGIEIVPGRQKRA